MQLLVGLISSVAFGWRALIRAELIAGTTGLGYMTLGVVQRYQTETVLLSMNVVGILWIILDTLIFKLIFKKLENRTLIRWRLFRTD